MTVPRGVVFSRLLPGERPRPGGQPGPHRRPGRDSRATGGGRWCACKLLVLVLLGFADFLIGEERHGYRILTLTSPAVPKAIAATCLHLRDQHGLLPHVYFEWAEGSPLSQYLRYIILGSGQVAPITREVLRRPKLASADRRIPA